MLKGCKIYAVPLLLLFGLVEESSRHKVNSGENAMLTLYLISFVVEMKYHMKPFGGKYMIKLECKLGQHGGSKKV